VDPKQTAEAYGEYLDGLVPAAYEGREQYAYDPAVGHRNATAHPPTGVPVLDQTPQRIRDVAETAGRIRRIGRG
jgi:hypothetical protein